MSVTLLLVAAIPLVLALLACGYVLIADTWQSIIRRRRR